MPDKTYFYYKCDIESKVGRKLREFWRGARNAALAADRYARKAGAVSYVQPVEYFEGGVDYVEFERKPDSRVWRKALTDRDGHDEYEPNCKCRREVLCLPDARFQPSDKWNMVFSKERLSWQDAKRMKPLAYWLGVMKRKPSDDTEADRKAVEERFGDCVFVPYMEYYANPDTDYSNLDPKVRERDKRKGVAPRALREAVYFERTRQQLPTVQVEWLFTLLGMTDAVEEAAQGTQPKDTRETPTFFCLDDSFYVRSVHPCKADGLHVILPAVYMRKEREALDRERGRG